jgi:hypothetical protein
VRLTLILRVAVGATWALAFVGKVVWPCPLVATLAHAIAGCPPWGTCAMAWALLSAEAACAVEVSLAEGDRLVRAAWGSTALGGVLLAGYVLSAVRLGELSDCPCFGVPLPGGPVVGLGKTVAFCAASVWLLVRVRAGGRNAWTAYGPSCAP